jgi:hypothetical protein
VLLVASSAYGLRGRGGRGARSGSEPAPWPAGQGQWPMAHTAAPGGWRRRAGRGSALHAAPPFGPSALSFLLPFSLSHVVTRPSWLADHRPLTCLPPLGSQITAPALFARRSPPPPRPLGSQITGPSEIRPLLALGLVPLASGVFSRLLNRRGRGGSAAQKSPYNCDSRWPPLSTTPNLH